MVVVLGVKQYERAPCLRVCERFKGVSVLNCSLRLQSNGKDVVRLFARLLYGTEVGQFECVCCCYFPGLSMHRANRRGMGRVWTRTLKFP